MSTNLRAIKEVSTEPLSKFVSHLAYRMTKVENDSQTQELENKEDIYSQGQDVDSKLAHHTLTGGKVFDFSTSYYPSFEPDANLLTYWIQGRNMGNNPLELSGFSRQPFMDDNDDDVIGVWTWISGNPELIDGTPFDDGRWNTGNIKSTALRFYNEDSTDHIGINDIDGGFKNSRIDGSRCMTYFFRVRPLSTNSQNGKRRTIFCKTDVPDATSNGDIDDAVRFSIDPNNKRLVIQLKRGLSNFNSLETNGQTFTENNIYDCFIVYASPGIDFPNAGGSYVNLGNHTDLWSRAITKFSISIWIQRDSFSGFKEIVSFNAGGQGFQLITSGTDLACKVNDGTGDTNVFTNIGSDTNWHHIVFTYDSTLGSNEQKLYKDGIKIAEGSNKGTLNGNNSVWLGNGFDGDMGDFRFWKDKALSQTEINNLFAENADQPMDMDYWLRMNQSDSSDPEPDWVSYNNPMIATKTASCNGSADYENREVTLYMAKSTDSSIDYTNLNVSGYGEEWGPDLSDAGARIFKRGPNSDDGGFHGDLYDFRIYRNLAFLKTDASMMFRNKWTINPIPFGQVMIADYYGTSPEFTIGYDSTGYDSTGFDTT